MAKLSGEGHESFPMGSEFAGANTKTGDIFGDKSSRTPPSQGSSLVMGLSECHSFHDESPDSLGEGRDVSTGKPDGPERGKVDNGGADDPLQWG